MGNGRELDVCGDSTLRAPVSQVSLPSGHVMAVCRFRPPHGPLRFPGAPRVAYRQNQTKAPNAADSHAPAARNGLMI